MRTLLLNFKASGKGTIKPVNNWINGDYQNLRLDGAHRLDWLKNEHNLRSKWNVY